MENTLAIRFVNYVQQHKLDMFAHSQFGGFDFFEAEQLVELPESEVIQTTIMMNEQSVQIEWQLICEALLPESRWSMLEFLNTINQELHAFSIILSLADTDDEFSTVTFRYVEPSIAVTDPAQLLCTYEFMARYVSDILYPEVLAIAQTHDE
ncbi:MAG: hypothetical protein ACRC3A_05290 [Culicoidibacterales bacterium]